MFVTRRHPANPLLAPVPSRAWESRATFNPSIVQRDGTTHLFYRAMGTPDALVAANVPVSSIGYAAAEGGGTFDNRHQAIKPSMPWDAYGCEDPRATFFEGRWYVFYTALGGFPYSAANIRVGVAFGDAPDRLSEKHLVTPFNAKAAALFPERVNGKATLILSAHTDEPPGVIAIAQADRVEDFWSPAYWETWHNELPEHALPDLRRSQDDHVEVGAVPVKTDDGWLLVYSHIQHYLEGSGRARFGVEALLLANDDPRRVIGRTAYPFLVPEEPYERFGLVPDIVFPTSVVIDGDRLDLYYGAADTTCASASLPLAWLLESMHEKKRAAFMTRHAGNPILTPSAERDWESRSVCNAAAIDLDGSVHLLYRAMGRDNTSVMGYARLADGLTIDERLPDPVYVPREPFEQKLGSPDGNSGCEDPRLSLINGRLQVCYTAYDGVHETRGAVADIDPDDFAQKRFDWGTPALTTPAGVNDKDVCLFELDNGEVVLMHRIEPNICIDRFPEFAGAPEAHRCIELMAPRPGMWDARKIGAAGPPIRITEGWLFIYHGIGEDRVYRLGAALLDETAGNVLARLDAPILEPVETWEREGLVNNVVFSCGGVIRGDTLFLYYGGADTSLGVATMSVAELVTRLTWSSLKNPGDKASRSEKPSRTEAYGEASSDEDNAVSGGISASSPRFVVFDLDSTLAESKRPLSASMGERIAALIRHVPVAVMSGASFAQFEEQFLSRLPDGTDLSRLYILPTSGAALYQYESGTGTWKPVYEERFSVDEAVTVEAAIEEAVRASDVALPERTYGPRFEHRGSQLAFSAIGQQAPLEEKRVWDPDQEKRRIIVRELAPQLPGMNVRIGGMTTIDITREGIDKAYGLMRLAELAGVPIADMLYVGDALYPGGNDEAVFKTGVATHAVTDPADTERFIDSLLQQ